MADAELTFTPTRPVALALTLRPLRRGRRDPTTRFGADGFWRATRTPQGPAPLHLARWKPLLDGPITARAWGPGAQWAVDRAPELCGGLDDADGFRPTHPVVRDLHRRMPGLRMCRSLAVTEALVPTIFEQKVTGMEARRA